MIFTVNKVLYGLQQNDGTMNLQLEELPWWTLKNQKAVRNQRKNNGKTT